MTIEEVSIKTESESFKTPDWWDSKSHMSLMNDLQLPFMRDAILDQSKGDSETVKPLTSLKILEVGCKDGNITEPLTKLGGTVVALTQDPKVIEIAKEHAEFEPELANLTYVKDTLEEHCERNQEKYDAVVACEVIQHAFNPITMLKESVECLKPGGSIFVMSVNRTWEAWLVGVLLYEKVLRIVPDGTHDFEKFISPNRISEELQKNGCTIKSVRGMKYNVLKGAMEWSDSTSIFYIIHAVKNEKKKIKY